MRLGGRLLAFALLGLLVWYLLRSAAGPVDAVTKLATALDSRGGNIIILVFFSLVFFISAMGLGYYLLDLMEQKLITPDNVLASSMFQFITGSAFGISIGALIQLLGGSHEK